MMRHTIYKNFFALHFVIRYMQSLTLLSNQARAASASIQHLFPIYVIRSAIVFRNRETRGTACHANEYLHLYTCNLYMHLLNIFLGNWLEQLIRTIDRIFNIFYSFKIRKYINKKTRNIWLYNVVNFFYNTKYR